MVVLAVAAAGAVGCAFIVKLVEGNDMHPDALVTVKLLVDPAASPDTVVVTPDPVIPPGLIIQVPAAGNPFKTTLPVAVTQVGCVMVPIDGAEGIVPATVNVPEKLYLLHDELLVTLHL